MGALASQRSTDGRVWSFRSFSTAPRQSVVSRAFTSLERSHPRHHTSHKKPDRHEPHPESYALDPSEFYNSLDPIADTVSDNTTERQPIEDSEANNQIQRGNEPP
jgi:hypothetical protein